MNTPKDCPVKLDSTGSDERRKWHIDRTLNIGHILTTIAMLASLLVVLSRFDTRLSLIESNIEVQKDTNKRHEATDHELKQTVKEAFDRLDSKLDKILEKR